MFWIGRLKALNLRRCSDEGGSVSLARGGMRDITQATFEFRDLKYSEIVRAKAEPYARAAAVTGGGLFLAVSHIAPAFFTPCKSFLQ